MLNAWFFLTFCFAAMDWLSLWFGKPRWNFFTKPAVLACLLLWFSSQGGWQAAPIWFGLALIFSLAGDVFLLLPEKHFILGLLAFLAAQLCYVLGLRPPFPVDGMAVIAIGSVVILMESLLFRNLRKGMLMKQIHHRLIPMLLVYSIAMSLMLFMATLTLAQPQWPAVAASLAAAGGALFFTSDALLSANRFLQPIPYGQLLVRILYHLGQVGLTAGILLRFAG